MAGESVPAVEELGELRADVYAAGEGYADGEGGPGAVGAVEDEGARLGGALGLGLRWLRYRLLGCFVGARGLVGGKG